MKLNKIIMTLILCCCSVNIYGSTDDVKLLLELYNEYDARLVEESKNRLSSVSHELTNALSKNALVESNTKLSEASSKLVERERSKVNSEIKGLQEELVNVNNKLQSELLNMSVNELTSIGRKSHNIQEDIQNKTDYINSLNIVSLNPGSMIDTNYFESEIKELEKMIDSNGLDEYDIGSLEKIQSPVKGIYYITSKFGTRVDPINGSTSYHNALDMRAPMNTDVLSIFNGKVVSAGYSNGYGFNVMVDHGNNIKTHYAHMNSLSVKEGDYIKQGGVVGKSGNTGRSTAPHLHVSLFIDGIARDLEVLYDKYR